MKWQLFKIYTLGASCYIYYFGQFTKLMIPSEWFRDIFIFEKNTPSSHVQNVYNTVFYTVWYRYMKINTIFCLVSFTEHRYRKYRLFSRYQAAFLFCFVKLLVKFRQFFHVTKCSYQLKNWAGSTKTYQELGDQVTVIEYLYLITLFLYFLSPWKTKAHLTGG